MGQIITLCTDFGAQDGYVAAMKGVILSIAPQATLVDISHEIPPQAILEGAFVLHMAYATFPQGTVHLVVVDPEVGSARRALALRTARHTFVAPDNGVLSYVLRDEAPWQAVELTERAYWRKEVSRTFHGRDILAPVAAHLAMGAPLAALGVATHDLVQVALPAPKRAADGSLHGHVVHVDRFGNLITDIPAHILAGKQSWRVSLGDARGIPLLDTYAQAAPGQRLALIGSHGNLEIAVRDGNAAKLLNAATGADVRIE